MSDDISIKYVSCKHENEALRWQVDYFIKRNAMLTTLLEGGQIKIKWWIRNCDGIEVTGNKEFNTIKEFDLWLNSMESNNNLPYGYEVI